MMKFGGVCAMANALLDMKDTSRDEYGAAQMAYGGEAKAFLT